VKTKFVHAKSSFLFVENRDVVPFCIEFKGKFFLAQDKFYNGSLYRWVQIIGSESEAATFKATMIIVKGEDIEVN